MPTNILLITSDQQRPDTLGAVNPAIRTPNLDRLASEGILFERGYTCNPVCTPTRVSMLTGQYPSRHGCFHVGTGLPEDYAPNAARLLSAAGYFTGLLGKAHFLPCLDPASFEAAPHIHDRAFFRRWSGPFYGFEHARLVIGHTCEAHGCGMHYGVWLEEQGIDMARYFGGRPYHAYGAWALPADLHGSRWVADETIRAVDMAAAAGKPFFLWASFQDPHNPYVVPEPWASQYDPGALPRYGRREGEMDDKPWFYRTLAGCPRPGDEGEPDARGWSDVRSLDLREEAPRRILAAYYGMIGLMDHHIGRIVAALAQRGRLDDTVIVFTSDHGDCLGNHGLWGKGLPVYEDVQRVPFIVRHPHCATAGARSRALQSAVDLAPTFLTLAGAALPAGMQGVNQSATWADAQAAAARDWAMVEFRPQPQPFMQRTFIEQRFKLVLYRGRTDGELYDLDRDPDQFVNLWSHASHRELRDLLIHRFISATMDSDGVLRPRTAPA